MAFKEVHVSKDTVSTLVTANRHLLMSIRNDDDEMMEIACEQYKQIVGEERALNIVAWSLGERHQRHWSPKPIERK